MKIITLDGRLGRDAEINQTNTGVKYLRFSMANDTKRQGNTVTEWFDVVVYDENTITKMAQYLTKGSYVIITGEPTASISIKDGQAYLNQRIRAFSINFGGGGSGKQANTAQAQGVAPQVAPQVGATVAQPMPHMTQPQQAAPVIPMPAAAPAPAAPVAPAPQVVPQPAYVPQQAPVTPVQSSPAYVPPATSADDDLPF